MARNNEKIVLPSTNQFSSWSLKEELSPIQITINDNFEDIEAKVMSLTNNWEIPRILTFKPDADVFADFDGLMTTLEKLNVWKSGITKLITPDDFEPTDVDLSKLELNSLTRQRLSKFKGTSVWGKLEKKKNILLCGPIEDEPIAKSQTSAQFDEEAVTLNRENDLQDDIWAKLGSGLSKDGLCNENEMTELFTKFWNFFSSGKTVTYGKDQLKSVFKAKKLEQYTKWNIARMKTLLSNLPEMQDGTEGIDTEYMYFGQLFTFFVLHVEDYHLFSINYLHKGSPKFWVGIGAQFASRVEEILQFFLPHEAEACANFLKEKRHMVHPVLLDVNGVRLDTIIQREKDIIITWPKGYHMGFNLGANVNSSTNFATKFWYNYLLFANRCVCKNADTSTIFIDPRPIIKQNLFTDPQDYRNWLVGKLERIMPECEGNGKSAIPPCGIFNNFNNVLGIVCEYMNKTVVLEMGTTSSKRGKKRQRLEEVVQGKDQAMTMQLEIAINELACFIKEKEICDVFVNQGHLELLRQLFYDSKHCPNIFNQVVCVFEEFGKHYKTDNEISTLQHLPSLLNEIFTIMTNDTTDSSSLLNLSVVITEFLDDHVIDAITSNSPYTNAVIGQKLQQNMERMKATAPRNCNIVPNDFNVLVNWLESTDKDKGYRKYVAAKYLMVMTGGDDVKFFLRRLRKGNSIPMRLTNIFFKTKGPVKMWLKETLKKLYPDKNWDEDTRISAVLINDVSVYKCEFCGRAMKDKKEAQRHVNRQHFTCPDCDFVTVTKNSIIKHPTRCIKNKNRSDDQNEKKKFKCFTCSEKFVRLYNLERHQNKHNKTLIFACSSCDLVFTRNDVLKSHIRQFHMNEREDVLFRPENS